MAIGAGPAGVLAGLFGCEAFRRFAEERVCVVRSIEWT